MADRSTSQPHGLTYRVTSATAAAEIAAAAATLAMVMARFALQFASFAASTAAHAASLALRRLARLRLFLTAQLFLFEVAQHSRTLVIDPNRRGETFLDFFVAGLVQFVF